MEELNNLHFSSPPSSLPDGLISAQGTVPPIPRPRRGSSSSSTSFSSSTPKQVLNFHGSLTRSGQSNSSNSNTRNCNKNNKIIRTPSVDSTGTPEVKLKPILVDNSDADSEEEENHVPYGSSNERLNCNARPKKSPHPRFASRSLPVTPRVNGNCSSGAHNHMNGGMTSSFITGSGGSSTPLLVAPHMANHFPMDGSLNSIGSLSPVTSQYVTCSSGIMGETPDKVLPGSIDYSSLPLPREDSFRIPNKRHISRHMSEPCIHEIPNSHYNSIGKCYSCPSKKNPSKHKRKDPIHYAAENETSGPDNHLRNSIGGIDSKSDNLETVEMQWKFIKTLVDELNKCRCQNNRMAVELHQSQMEIQMLKGALDAYIDAGIQPGVLSEMVGQIHAAQKVRDEAMMSRIKLANEERDAAITQTQSLLEKLGYSPKSSVDYLKFNVYSCNDQSPHCNYESSSCKSNKENVNLTAIEEELKALRLALHIQEQEKSFHSDQQNSNRSKESDGDTQEVLEELKTKLKESEISKLKLQEKCSSLEHVFDHLHRKINGLSSVEGLSMNPSSLSFLDMSLYGNKKHEEETETSPRISTVESSPNDRYKKNMNDRVRKPVEGDTETEGDSLSSSADSGETSSATSWKHICLDNHTSYPSNESGSLCSSGCSSSSRQPSTIHSHDGTNNNNASRNASSSTDRPTPNSSSRGEFKPRNLGGVTLMGPITEL